MILLGKNSLLTLRVEEAFQDEYGRGMARICPSFLRSYGIAVGDIIELTSEGRKVGVIAVPSRKKDWGANIVRLDPFIRGNLQVTFGDRVTIRRIIPPHATSITTAPAEERLRLLIRPDALKSCLLKRPVVLGEVLPVKGKVRKIPPKKFQAQLSPAVHSDLIKILVVATDPQGIVVVGVTTEVRVQKDYNHSSQAKQSELRPPRRAPEFIYS